MGEIPRGENDTSQIRALARLVEPIHTICYYAPEVAGFSDAGFKGWWHAYFAYRSAPMGAVSAPAVTAAFYNFAPAMVSRAVPNCWDVMSPAAVHSLQIQLTGQALQRSLGDFADQTAISQSAATLRKFAGQLPIGARPLYAAWAAEPWPTASDAAASPAATQPTVSDTAAGPAASDDLLALWHGCTLLREFRFDGHNIALATNDLDPVECHVMMVTHGHGNAATIQKIRGWTEAEWDAACERLTQRGWIDAAPAPAAAEQAPAPAAGQAAEQAAEPAPAITQTDMGLAGRKQVEADTDALATAVLDPSRGGIDEAEMRTLLANLAVVLEHLIASGEVSGVWPPPHVIAKG